MKYKHFLGITTIFLFGWILCVQKFSFALNLGTNITIYDNTSLSTNGWYGQQEDNEVEPGCVRKQIWDLEGMFLNKYKLTVIGGFDFANGIGTITVGDIFLDIDGDAIYGGNQKNPNHRRNGIIELNNIYGYDYAIRLNFDNNHHGHNYEVFHIDNDTTVYSVYYAQNDWSNPWKYKKVRNEQPIYTGSLIYYNPTFLDTINIGFLGDSSNNNHYGFSVDLSFLPPGTTFISHFTLKCGNDNLIGKGTLSAPEPATIFLFGTGLIGFVAFAKKRIKARQR